MNMMDKEMNTVKPKSLLDFLQVSNCRNALIRLQDRDNGRKRKRMKNLSPFTRYLKINLTCYDQPLSKEDIQRYEKLIDSSIFYVLGPKNNEERRPLRGSIGDPMTKQKQDLRK